MSKKYHRQQGQTMTEYVVLIAFMAILMMAGVYKYGNSVYSIWMKAVKILTS